MHESYLYQKIVAEIRQDILLERLKPGDRLPTVRQMTERWNCTIGTVQHAYHELASQGLIVSRTGQGTHVIKTVQPGAEAALRRAYLVHRSEAFLLEVLTAGYPPEEIEAALQQALERWQVISLQPEISTENTLRFAGSHDLALSWLAAHFPEIVPQFTLQLGFSGSLGGLIALVEGKADLAGSHLWDEESNTYNAPYVKRLLPGQKVALLTLAHRRLGLLLRPGNLSEVHGLADLVRPGLRFVNRQVGSGTRVWLDAELRRQAISEDLILGYDDERMTHLEVAAAVAQSQAEVGFGLEAAAQAYGLDFIFLLRERYDLVIPKASLELKPVSNLINWLLGEEAHQAISAFTGYDTSETGNLTWV